MNRFDNHHGKELRATLSFKVRFSEIDAMRVVWHGAYVKYLEDAREYFGQMFEFDYNLIVANGYFAPIVDMSIHYKQPIKYGMCPEITIIYRPTESAKIVFDYEIYNPDDGSLLATGHTVQVFMDTDHQLVWETPAFYDAWKKRWNVI
jgi:acyl-CoA thioester hydrolase